MYSFVRWALEVFFSTFFRLKISGAENIPADSGVIIAANHASNWDPPLLGSTVSRRLYFMAKEELFAIPVLGWLLKFNAFPVRRGAADRTAIRKTMDLLEQGKAVVLFPEGTRSKTGKFGKPQPGVAMIALKSGATIIPTAIIGTYGMLQRGNWLPQVKVKFGKPIVVTQGDSNKEMMDIITKSYVQEITRLLEEG